MSEDFEWEISKVSVNNLYKEFQASAERFHAGTSLPRVIDSSNGTEVPSPLANVVSAIMKSVARTTPPLIPTVDGVPVDLITLERELITRGQQFDDFLGHIIYIEAQPGMDPELLKYSQPWASLSGLHSKLSGAKDPYDTNAAKNTQLKLSNVNCPTINTPQHQLAEWFRTTMEDHGFKTGAVQIALGSGTTVLGIEISNPGQPKILFKSKARANTPVGGILRSHDMIPVGENKTLEPAWKTFIWGESLKLEIDKVTGEILQDAGIKPYKVVVFEQSPLAAGTGAAPLAGKNLDIEHFRSISGESQQYLLENLTATLRKAEKGLEKAQKLGDSEQIQISNTIIKNILEYIAYVEGNLQVTDFIGRAFAKTKIDAKGKTTAFLDKVMKSLEPKGDKLGLYLIIEENNDVSLKSGEITSKHYAKFADLKYNLFGPGLTSANRGLQSKIEQMMKERTLLWANTIRSPAPITMVAMAALAKIFDDPDFLDQVKAYDGKNKHSSKVFIALFDTKEVKLKKPKGTKVKNPSNKSTRKYTHASRKSVSRKGTLNTGKFLILQAINANIYQAVVAQMTGGSTLANRTGTFARSVKATELLGTKQNYQVKYTYKPDPYNVFSNSKLGRDPWNSKPRRDPGLIIDAALRSIGYNKFMGAIGDITGGRL